VFVATRIYNRAQALLPERPAAPPFRMSTSTSHPSTSSPDIPFHGFVETTADALRLIQAARQGVIPRITRRLNEEERATIVRSGAVFVFSVEESGIRRWTEGLSWSASRIAGNFLVSHIIVCQDQQRNRGW